MTLSPTLRCSALAGLALSALLSACAPLLIGGAAVSGALMYSDRRTSGAQIEDQAIEIKAEKRLKTLLGDRGHVNVASYNRIVLVTGEVATEDDRKAVEQLVAGVENQRSVVNETAVMALATLSSSSNDLIITSKVKATFIDAAGFEGQAFKVVTERGTVYLMGRVTAAEADRATQMARNVGGVQKVVRVVELISESELREIRPPKKAR